MEAFIATQDASRLYAPIARDMKLADIQEAHGIAESGGAGSKIVMVP